MNVAALGLKREFIFSHLCDVVEILQIKEKLDIDELYEEYCVTLPCQQEIVKTTAPVAKKWSTLLQILSLKYPCYQCICGESFFP